MQSVPVTVAGEIVIDIDALPLPALEQIRGALTIENEERDKAASVKQFGWWDMPEMLALYREEKRRGGRNVICLPRGFAMHLTAIFQGLSITPAWNDLRTSSPAQDGYFRQFALRDYQLDAALKMLNSQQGFYKCPAGGGKGHPLDTEVPVWDGGFKRWGDLEVGDTLIGREGPTKVTAIHDRGDLPTYRVTFSDHTSVICDADHIWHVGDDRKRRRRGEWSNKTTTELMEEGLRQGNSWRWRIPIASAEKQRQHLPLDPYMVGALIANGCLTGTGTQLTTPDTEVIDRINQSSGPGQVRKVQDTTEVCDRYQISGITQITRDLGMRVRSSEKRIPELYLSAFAGDRRCLLMGLMDGDGSSRGENRRSAIYHTTSPGLAQDVAELVRSLGGTASVGEKPRDGKPTEYPVYINPATSMLLFGTSRKMRPTSTSHRKPIRRIVSIEPTGRVEPIRCITVDAPDSLYMIGRSYTLTHNTVTTLGMAAWRNQRTLVIVDRSNLAEQWRTRAAQFYGFPMDELEDGSLYATFDGWRSPGLLGNDIWEERDFTVALRQTLHSRAMELDATRWWQRWGMVVFDEAHHLVAETTGDIGRKITARDLFGVSATPSSSPMKSAIVHSIVGPIVAETTRQELYDREVLMRPEIHVERGTLEFAFHPDHDAVYDNETGSWSCQMEGCKKTGKHSHRNNYSSALKALVDSKERNARIAEAIMKQRGHYVLVPSRQLKHLDNIRKALIAAGWPKDKIWTLTGKENAEGKSKAIVDAIEASDEAVLFSTVADEGFDLPKLDRGHLVFPIKGEIPVIQTIGRLERIAEGKDDAIWTDHHEPNIVVFVGQFDERRRIFGMQGYDVHDSPITPTPEEALR